MACHGGGNNRLNDHLAEPGFPNIDDHVINPTGLSRKKRPAQQNGSGGHGKDLPVDVSLVKRLVSDI